MEAVSPATSKPKQRLAFATNILRHDQTSQVSWIQEAQEEEEEEVSSDSNFCLQSLRRRTWSAQVLHVRVRVHVHVHVHVGSAGFRTAHPVERCLV